MYRVVVLTSLVILLLAVAGVSVAQDGRILSPGGSNSDAPPGSTAPEATTFGTTMAEDPETSAPPAASSEPDDGEHAPEPTVLTEPTVGDTEDNEESTVSTPVEAETRAPGSNDVAKPVGGGRAIGRPEHAGQKAIVGHPATGKPEELGNKAEHGRGGDMQGETLCHKGKNTLTVGAPALAAHLRHGDSVGACQPDGAGSDPSGVTRGPEAVKSGGNGASEGQDKVVLCHKGKNTLTVGSAAQAAHLRHGDGVGACR